MSAELILVGALAAIVGGFLGKLLEGRRIARHRGSAEEQAKQILEGSQREADNIRKAAELEGKEEAYRLKAKLDEEADEHRVEIEKLERRVLEREELLDRKLAILDDRQTKLDTQAQEIGSREKAVDAKGFELEELERRVDSLEQEVPPQASSQTASSRHRGLPAGSQHRRPSAATVSGTACRWLF